MEDESLTEREMFDTLDSKLTKAIRGELHKEHLHEEVSVDTRGHTIHRWHRDFDTASFPMPDTIDRSVSARLRELGARYVAPNWMENKTKEWRWFFPSEKIPQIATILRGKYPGIADELIGKPYERHRNNHLAKKLELHSSMAAMPEHLHDIPVGEQAKKSGLDYYKFQKAGVEYITRRKGTLLGDSMGHSAPTLSDER